MERAEAIILAISNLLPLGDNFERDLTKDREKKSARASHLLNHTPF